MTRTRGSACPPGSAVTRRVKPSPVPLLLAPENERIVMAPAPYLCVGQRPPCRTLDQIDNANQVPSFENVQRLYEDQE